MYVIEYAYHFIIVIIRKTFVNLTFIIRRFLIQ